MKFARWRMARPAPVGQLVAVILVVFATTLLQSQSNAPALTAEQIVGQLAAREAERAASSRAYTGLRRYTLDYKGFPGDKHAEMVVEVASVPPEKKLTIVSESGSKILINRVLRKLVENEREASAGNNSRNTKLSTENYDFDLVGEDTLADRRCYVLQVKAKKSNKFLYVGKVWIDAEDFALAQISARPARNPSFWISATQIDHRYAKWDDLWLPQSNRSTSKVRLGGQAALSIDYYDYKLSEPTPLTRFDEPHD
jgi:hypothetical protein